MSSLLLIIGHVLQYFLEWQKESINNLIEEAILEAEERGAKVLSLGLLNQASITLNNAIYKSWCICLGRLHLFFEESARGFDAL